MAGVEFRPYSIDLKTYSSPPAVIVAPTAGQAAVWRSELGFDAGFDIWTPGYVHDIPRWHSTKDAGLELFFVGEWGKIAVRNAAELIWMARTVKDFQATYVCDAWGEVIERLWMWVRWPASSTGRETKWHALSEVSKNHWAVWPEFGDEWSWSTLCGVTGDSPGRSGRDGMYEVVERWGPPRDACGACRIMLSRKPVGTEAYQDVKAKAGKWHMQMLRTATLSGAASKSIRTLSTAISESFVEAAASIQRLKDNGYIS